MLAAAARWGSVGGQPGHRASGGGTPPSSRWPTLANAEMKRSLSMELKV